ncbi:putative metallo-beta-lactamase, ribonuclease Z/Hydroxyacylglutathione hydrolase [Septoria linicola]|nr:putative metallo-beta-lactamase, ribonuclease Z/Hydroxyacylglutathione hydrolase [Septoria linicola]
MVSSSTATTALGIPPSTSTVRVSIIDTTMRSRIPLSIFAGPPIAGLDTLNAPAYSFLITHEDGTGAERKLVFDLGLPVDLEKDFPPAMYERLTAMKGSGGMMESTKYVSDILEEEGVELEGIEAVVWSHAHGDHVGKPSLFHPSTTLIVGPGVKESCFPGWPEVESSPVLVEAFDGREVKELAPAHFTTEIGGLKAFDYFGDGSFYFLLAPGHALGHINALARTTEDTFIYMAADSFHHTSQLRPHTGARLPESVTLHSCSCTADLLQPVHPVSHTDDLPERYHSAFGLPDVDYRDVPFQTIVEAEDGTSIAVGVQAARDTIKAIQRFDASEDVFVIAAHDASLFDVLEYLPKNANDWKAKGWKDAWRWAFLEDVQAAVASKM